MPCFVVMKWSPPQLAQTYLSGAKSETRYTSGHVNRLYEMLTTAYPEGVRFICITDNADDLDPGIEAIIMPESLKQVIATHGGRYAKLWLYSPEFLGMARERFVYLDLDIAVCGRMDAFFEAPTSLAIMRGTSPEKPRLTARRIAKVIRDSLRNPGKARLYLRHPAGLWCKYNSSIVGIDPDMVDPAFWRDLDIDHMKEWIAQEGIIGTDQATLHLAYEGSVTVLGREDGYWAFSQLSRFYQAEQVLPDCRAIIFPGHPDKKPWPRPFVLNILG